MAKYSFACVDGVEISEMSIAAARKNLSRVNVGKSRIFHSDAADFTDNIGSGFRVEAEFNHVDTPHPAYVYSAGDKIKVAHYHAPAGCILIRTLNTLMKILKCRPATASQ